MLSAAACRKRACSEDATLNAVGRSPVSAKMCHGGTTMRSRARAIAGSEECGYGSIGQEAEPRRGSRQVTIACQKLTRLPLCSSSFVLMQKNCKFAVPIGVLAQLVERQVRNLEVRSSTLLCSTENRLPGIWEAVGVFGCAYIVPTFLIFSDGKR